MTRKRHANHIGMGRIARKEYHAEADRGGPLRPGPEWELLVGRCLFSEEGKMGSIERRMFIVGMAASAVGSIMTSRTRAQEASPRSKRIDQPIRIAAVTPLSGRAAGPFGLPGRNAAELLVEAINAGGELPSPYSSKGLAGRRLLLTVYDEAGSPSEQAELFRRIHANGADAVVGYIGSGAAMAVAPVSEELRQLTVVSGAGTSQLYAQQSWGWVFRTQTTTTPDAVGAARYVATLPEMSRIAFGGVNQNYPWGTDSWAEFRAALLQLLPEARDVGGHFAALYSAAVEEPLESLKTADARLVHSANWGLDLFKLVDAARVRLPSARLVLISGESGLSRLAASVPDGTVIGGRGSHGWLAPDTEINRWFTASYRDRYEVAPIYPAYGMANALLGLKAAWDKTGPTAGPAEVVSALAGSTFQGIGSTIAMVRANGRQAIAEAAYGTTRRKPVTGQIELVDVRRFPPDCVNPPDGVTPLKWIESGFSGGHC
jgi:branched-chain amino acid transport system substrate-binding protein